MTLHIQFRIRVRDLLSFIQHEFGSVEGLGTYLAKHPHDSARVMLYEAARRNGHRPNATLTFGRLYIGDHRQAISAAKLELLDHLMRHPGLSLRALARAVGKTPATVSEHLEDLEQMGLVLKESQGAGRAVALRTLPREIHIRLTADEDAGVA